MTHVFENLHDDLCTVCKAFSKCPLNMTSVSSITHSIVTSDGKHREYDIFRQLPFNNISNFDMESSFQTLKPRVQMLMEDHGIIDFMNENYLLDLSDPDDLNHCKYFDENEFNQKSRNRPDYLIIFSMNIRSLPKHGGELIHFLNLLATRFDIIVLTEIGSRNLSTVEHLMDHYDFHYVQPSDNMFGGVGIFINQTISGIHIFRDVNVKITCVCPKCQIETLCIQFDFLNEDYVVGGIYRQPNGNTAHFIDDLETAIGKLKDNITVILGGHINNDIIKFENEQTMAYLTTLLSNRFLPFITHPTRITDFSATCIDHIFVKPGGHVKQNISAIYSGIFYFDISDHLPCFLSLTGKNCSTKYKIVNQIYQTKDTNIWR